MVLIGLHALDLEINDSSNMEAVDCLIAVTAVGIKTDSGFVNNLVS